MKWVRLQNIVREEVTAYAQNAQITGEIRSDFKAGGLLRELSEGDWA
jgi:hypothetical protein